MSNFCGQCRNLSDLPICPICSNPNRDSKIICVVESTEDLIAIEASNAFSGTYYVLHGLLSPIDGVGPQELRIDQLKQTVHDLACEEVILATNPTVEGETTAQYIMEVPAEELKNISHSSRCPGGRRTGLR